MRRSLVSRPIYVVGKQSAKCPSCGGPMVEAQFYTSDSYPITDGNSEHVEGHVCPPCYKKLEVSASLIGLLGSFLMALGLGAGALIVNSLLGGGLDPSATALLRGLMFALIAGAAVMLIKGVMSCSRRISDIKKTSDDAKFYSAYAYGGGKIKKHHAFSIDSDEE